MANKKISELPAATSLTTADLLPVVQGGVTMQVTPDLLPLSTAATTALAGKDPVGAATAAQNYAVQRGNHTGTQTADTITDGTTNKAYTALEKTKLAGVAYGATANRPDTDTDTAITAAINGLINGAPGALDTLKELADALADDANYAATITTALAGKTSPTDVDAKIATQAASVAATYVSLSQALIAWTLTQAFTVTSATRDANEAITTASVIWPDGATGTFTTDTASSAFPGAIDAYHVTHVLNGTTKTVTQPAVTRDAGGAVTAQPALVVA